MSSKDLRPVLRVGCLAYYDTLHGLLKCKVLALRGVPGAPSSESSAYLELTVKSKYWPKGSTFDTWTIHAIPRAAVSFRRQGARIAYYTVEVPQS